MDPAQRAAAQSRNPVPPLAPTPPLPPWPRQVRSCVAYCPRHVCYPVLASRLLSSTRSSGLPGPGAPPPSPFVGLRADAPLFAATLAALLPDGVLVRRVQRSTAGGTARPKKTGPGAEGMPLCSVRGAAGGQWRRMAGAASQAEAQPTVLVYSANRRQLHPNASCCSCPLCGDASHCKPAFVCLFLQWCMHASMQVHARGQVPCRTQRHHARLHVAVLWVVSRLCLPACGTVAC